MGAMGAPAAAGGAASPAMPAPGGAAPNADSGLASGIMQAQRPMTGYEQSLAKRSRPDMNAK